MNHGTGDGPSVVSVEEVFTIWILLILLTGVALGIVVIFPVFVVALGYGILGKATALVMSVLRQIGIVSSLRRIEPGEIELLEEDESSDVVESKKNQ